MVLFQFLVQLVILGVAVAVSGGPGLSFLAFSFILLSYIILITMIILLWIIIHFFLLMIDKSTNTRKKIPRNKNYNKFAKEDPHYNGLPL